MQDCHQTNKRKPLT